MAVVTAPRIVRPGDVVFATARTIARFYLLRPDGELVQAFMYLLGHYAKKHGIVLMAACLMSTHWHLVYRDPLANGPAFLRDFDRGLANVVKAMRGWRGPVFRPRPSQVRLKTLGALVDKIGYTLANAVAAALVLYAKGWPGVVSRIDDMGRRTFRVPRPRWFFGENGAMPAEQELRFELDRELVAQHGEEGARAELERSLNEHERQARDEVRRKGWKVLGAKRALEISPFRRAKSYEVFGERNPTFATKGGGAEAFFQAVEEKRRFERDYHQAFEGWRRGERDVLFPFGAWLMRVVHGARCREAPG